MEMLGTETFVGRDSYPAVVIVGIETRPMPVWIGGDSSPASDHGSPLKRTQPQPESVSTDLHVLSGGFITGEINGNVGYRNICRAGFQSRHLCCRVWKPDPCRFASAGTQVPPQTMEVRSSGLRPSRFQPTCMFCAGDLSQAKSMEMSGLETFVGRDSIQPFAL